MNANNEFYNQSLETVFARLETSVDGLSASQAKSRLSQYGLNEFSKRRETTAWQILLDQFENFFTWLLLAAAVLSWLTSDRVEVAIILIVVAVNIVVGFVQEYKANHALKSLRRMLAGTIKVRRDGKLQALPHLEIVPGDVVELAAGEKVPADLRLMEASSLRVDEAALTGESKPISKQAKALAGKLEVPDQINMAFAGTLVVAGRGVGVVTATGLSTHFGTIAKLVSEQEEDSPLELRLRRIGQWFTIIALLIGSLVFVLSLARGENIIDTFTFVIALLVAAVPESLPTIVTLSLAIGVVRLARSHSIVRRLPVVETLGDLDVIATDKTGTLTKNEMTTTKVVVITKDTEKIVEADVSGVGYDTAGSVGSVKVQQSAEFKQLITAGVLCNDATVENGDPTERALLVLAAKAGLDIGKIRAVKRNDEIPFDPAKKFMATSHNKTISVKGALEAVLEMCEIDDQTKQALVEKEAQMAAQGLRVLAIAGGLTNSANLANKLSKLKFYGLVGMLDPVREGVKEALEVTKKAGIRTIIITGDHKLTAQAIARQLGMSANDEDVIEGKAIRQMSADQLKKLVAHVEIFSRAMPEDKLKIVEALKDSGKIVAVTGDGVNDAPALKSAHVGIAMGRRGTDVAKETADLILLDDSFATIVKSIEFGRGVFDNIKKFITLLLAGNLDEILLVAVAALASLPAPFTTVQLLWINLATDAFPALALGFQPSAEGLLHDKPSQRNRGIIRLIFTRAFAIALFGFIAGFVLWWRFLPQDVTLAQTVIFTFMVVFELVIVFPIFRDRPLFAHGPKPTWILYAAVALSLILQLAALYGPFAYFFGTVPLGVNEWLWIGGLVILGYSFAEFLNYLASLRNASRYPPVP